MNILKLTQHNKDDTITVWITPNYSRIVKTLQTFKTYNRDGVMRYKTTSTVDPDSGLILDEPDLIKPLGWLNQDFKRDTSTWDYLRINPNFDRSPTPSEVPQGFKPYQV